LLIRINTLDMPVFPASISLLLISFVIYHLLFGRLIDYFPEPSGYERK